MAHEAPLRRRKIEGGLKSTLTLNQCTLPGNYAVGGGGAIRNDGTAILNGCTVSGNSAPQRFYRVVSP